MATPPKKPQDRKPKAEKALEITDTPGWDLMKPIEDIPAWDQTDLIAMLQDVWNEQEKAKKQAIKELKAELDAAGEPYEEDEIEVEADFDVRIIGRLIKSLIPFTRDEAAYTKFVSGAGGIERGGELAMAWVGQMGESVSSAT